MQRYIKRKRQAVDFVVKRKRPYAARMLKIKKCAVRKGQGSRIYEGAPLLSRCVLHAYRLIMALRTAYRHFMALRRPTAYRLTTKQLFLAFPFT